MTRKFFALTALSILAMSAAQTPTAPATVDTNAEKAAWEALMSPVGEYAAYATYDAILNKFGNVEPYASIRQSEQMHINALTRQLQRYGVTVPANPYLGKITLTGDLKTIAGTEANGEVENAAMYDKLLPLASGDAMLQRVFTNLQSASRDMHLVMFRKAAAGNGTLSAADMTALHNRNMNNMGMNGQGQQLGRNQNAPRLGQQMGQQMAQQNQNGRGNGYGFNQQGNRGYGMGQGMGMGRGQMMQGQMNPADCPMMQGQGRGQGFGPGWRR